MWQKWTGIFVSNIAISKMSLNRIKCASADWDVVKMWMETIAVQDTVNRYLKINKKIKRGLTLHCINIPWFDLKFLPIVMQSLKWCNWEILGNHQILRHSLWHANNEILQIVNFCTSNILLILRKKLMFLHKELHPYKDTIRNLWNWTSVNTNPSCWPSNPVSFGKILFWISLIIQWAWSMFPSEGWRSDNEGSKLRSHPKLLHKPCMNPESTIIFLGVASAVFQPMFMSNDENTFNNGGGVFMGKGWEWEWGFLQIINIRGQAWMLYGAYMSKLAEWVWNLCLSNPHLSWPLGKRCQYARKTT